VLLMNVQTYDMPPKFWAPRLHPWWFRMARLLRNRDLRKQRILQVELRGLEHVEGALRRQAGILLTPNHSFHYDSYCLLRAADRLRCPFYIMTAWQVFGMTNKLGRWTLQRSGCFSINREGTDREAFRTAVEILRQRPNPLVIFPEGDVYHTNDRVMPFRDGAAAVALAAAKRSPRPIACIPVALKAWYASDPTRELEAAAADLERRLWWRPCEHLPLRERIYRLAEGLLVLKEYEYFGEPRSGTVGERMRALSAYLLEKQERKYTLNKVFTEIPERVQEVRRRIIPQLSAHDLPEDQRRELRHDLEELFFVMQLYSYPGNYVSALPTTERLAETLDKLEEDVLGRPYPSVRGERKVVVQFGEPVMVPRDRGKKHAAAELTDLLEQRVQQLLDQLNVERQHVPLTFSDPPRPPTIEMSLGESNDSQAWAK
jgi:1-acyl-sn-glycerol-3-phosphate acyltransferase